MSTPTFFTKQVEIFSSSDLARLEIGVNNFLSTIASDKIVDIKYQAQFGEDYDYFSAMVIYLK